MPHYESLPYRPCVGLMVLNRPGRVFIGRRIDGPEHVDATHVWQMPQGGVDQGEDTWPAALRELYEETNIRSVEQPRRDRGVAHLRHAARHRRAGLEGPLSRADGRNGTRCASPATRARSTSHARGGHKPEFMPGAGSRWRTCRR